MTNRNVFEEFLPPARPVAVPAYRFGSITSVNPVRVQLDGDTAPSSATPILLTPVSSGDRVQVRMQLGKPLVVLGVISDGTGWGDITRYMIDAGRELITAAGNGVGSVTVHFAKPFPIVPYITATLWSGSSTVINAQVYEPTTTQFDLVMQRSNTTATAVNWIAVAPL